MLSKYEQIIEESKKIIVEQNKIIENCDKTIKKARLILDEHELIVKKHDEMKKKTEDAVKNQKNELHTKRLMVAEKILTKDYVIKCIAENPHGEYSIHSYVDCIHNRYEKCNCRDQSYYKKITFDDMLILLKNKCVYNCSLMYQYDTSFVYKCEFKYYKSGRIIETFDLCYEHTLTPEVLDS